MKRVCALLLCILMVCTLAACGNDPLYNQGKQETQATEESKNDISTYPKTFDGLQSCLKDMQLIPDDDKQKTEMMADIIGASNGYRYTINNSVFVELYEYTDTESDAAKRILESVDKNGTFSIIDGMDPLTAVMSGSKKFMLAYNATIKSDVYDKVAEVIKEF